MLGHKPFYWKHFRKYVSLMGTLLNDISIVRETNGKEKIIKVPVSFAQRDKQLEMLASNPELKNTWRNILPRLSFEMGSPTYMPDRKDNANNTYYTDELGKKRLMQHPAAPYDIPFTAYLWVPYYEDGLQVVEQILPFFQPEFMINVKEIPELKLNRDVSVSLQSVTQNDNFDGDYTEFRIIEWQFEFVLKGYMYGPIIENNVIKKAMVNYLFDFKPDADPVVEYTATVTPFEADRDDPHTIEERTIIK